MRVGTFITKETCKIDRLHPPDKLIKTELGFIQKFELKYMSFYVFVHGEIEVNLLLISMMMFD